MARDERDTTPAALTSTADLLRAPCILTQLWAIDTTLPRDVRASCHTAADALAAAIASLVAARERLEHPPQ